LYGPNLLRSRFPPAPDLSRARSQGALEQQMRCWPRRGRTAARRGSQGALEKQT